MTPEVKERFEQIRHGNVPEGYKKSLKGIIPKHWEVVRLDSVATGFDYGMNAPAVDYDGANRYIRITDIDEESRKYISEKCVSPGDMLDERYLVLPNDILFARTGASTGKTYLYDCSDGRLFFAGFLIRIHVMNNTDARFVFYYTQSDEYKRWLDVMSVRSGQPGINAQEFAAYRIMLPSTAEQIKIANILSAQDKIIELKMKQISEKQQQKKYLMQQLLTGKKRLHGFDGEWQSCRLHQIAKRIRRKNTVGNENVLTISAQYGLINQSEFFNKEIASEDKSNYYLLQRNDFAYNKSYSSGYPFGAIKRLTRYDIGIVSPLYICFEIVGENVYLEYMEQYFEAGLMNREIQAFAQEGARNHGLLNIAVDDFFNSKFILPSLEEQQAIAAILSAADKEIELLHQDLEQEKQKKKALMQLLLTGIVRVNV